MGTYPACQEALKELEKYYDVEDKFKILPYVVPDVDTTMRFQPKIDNGVSKINNDISKNIVIPRPSVREKIQNYLKKSA